MHSSIVALLNAAAGADVTEEAEELLAAELVDIGEAVDAVAKGRSITFTDVG